VKRENPRGILALVYNRHAATEIRRRLFDLIGDDARGVTISTCHGLAMRMVGASFAKRADKVESVDFDGIMAQAVALLKGEGLSRDEAEAQRDTPIEGYRWILVDEYQDIGPEEYELIAAVAGRSIEDGDRRLSDAAFLLRRPQLDAVDVSECRNLYRTLDPSEVELVIGAKCLLQLHARRRGPLGSLHCIPR
jgi:superfamily I DNA/RNA helicase